MSAIDRRVHVGIIGCGDVVARRYLPGLTTIADRVRVSACFDPMYQRSEQIAALANACGLGLATAVSGLDRMLADDDVDAILNLTPAPLHGELNALVLERGKHLYSEKPLAATAAEADALIGHARALGRVFACAPALMATPRFRWIADLLGSGRLGRPTLVCAQLADMGPAAWREYGGDPRPFYSSAVGTLMDQGIYLLHAVTGLLGPAHRVKATGILAVAERTIRSASQRGEKFVAEAPDHVLVHLECGNGAVAQVLSSFAVPATRTPLLEIHCERGTLSLDDHLSAHGPINVYLSDESPAGCDGWLEGVPERCSWASTDDTVAVGAVHFVEAIRGECRLLLDAEHGRHVLQVAEAIKECLAVDEGRTLEPPARSGSSPNQAGGGRASGAASARDGSRRSGAAVAPGSGESIAAAGARHRLSHQ